jgi:large subunit ribosomal protein L25
MTKKYLLKAEKRMRSGKGAARAIRREGYVPGVIYGDNKDPILIKVLPNDMEVYLNQHGLFTKQFEIEVDGEKHLTMCQDLDQHVINGKLQHVDFLRISPNKIITTEIPVHVVGEEDAPGLKEGGILNVVQRSLEISCKASIIPEYIEIDISELNIGDSVHIVDVKLPEGVELADKHAEFTMLTIAAPRMVVEEEEETTEEEAGEVEATEQKGEDEEKDESEGKEGEEKE